MNRSEVLQQSIYNGISSGVLMLCTDHDGQAALDAEADWLREAVGKIAGRLLRRLPVTIDNDTGEVLPERLPVAAVVVSDSGAELSAAVARLGALIEAGERHVLAS